MTLKPRLLVIGSLLLGLSATGFSADHSIDINFSKKIKVNQKKTMNRDLEVLQNFQFNQPVNEETLKVFGFESLNTQSMIEWLEARVKYVIRDQKVEDMMLKATPRYNFPNDEKPIIERGTPRPSEPGGKKGVTVMSNIGAGLYFAGKMSNNSFELRIPKPWKDWRVQINSPRAGIIQIGPGHFLERLMINKEEHKSKANSLGRLATFFHEARHSDGAGKHLGFFHAVCPKGHDFEGINACDRNLNGPYKIGALAMVEFLKNCDDCTVEEKEAMKVHYLEAEGRIITETKTVKRGFDDGSLELAELKMELQMLELTSIFGPTQEQLARKSEIEQKIKELAEKAGAVKITKSVFWDPTPEGQR